MDEANKIEPRLYTMVYAKHNTFNGKFTLHRLDTREIIYEGHPQEVMKYCMLNNYDLRFGG